MVYLRVMIWFLRLRRQFVFRRHYGRDVMRFRFCVGGVFETGLGEGVSKDTLRDSNVCFDVVLN